MAENKQVFSRPSSSPLAPSAILGFARLLPLTAIIWTPADWLLPMDINQLTYAINGAVFEVNRVLGPGFLEKVYENALLTELSNRGLKAENPVPITVHYKDNVVGEYTADILVEEKVILELKTVESIENVHEAQLLNYLRATGIQVGLLVNFRHPKAEIKRMVLDLSENRKI